MPVQTSSPAPGHTITPATPQDGPRIKALVIAAYEKYTPRIGKPPAPMLQDYTSIITASGDSTERIFVLRAARDSSSPTTYSGPDSDSTKDDLDVSGAISISHAPRSSALHVANVVVDPRSQGRGYGRVLLQFAESEARKGGCAALELYTNVAMWENVGLYAKMGFTETGRRVEEGYERVFFRKEIAAGEAEISEER
jgi:ribosomal protein S18 acetylase RimI-like enzyme